MTTLDTDGWSHRLKIRTQPADKEKAVATAPAYFGNDTVGILDVVTEAVTEAKRRCENANARIGEGDRFNRVEKLEVVLGLVAEVEASL